VEGQLVKTDPMPVRVLGARLYLQGAAALVEKDTLDRVGLRSLLGLAREDVEAIVEELDRRGAEVASLRRQLRSYERASS
jgi:hypothetical protein